MSLPIIFSPRSSVIIPGSILEFPGLTALPAFPEEPEDESPPSPASKRTTAQITVIMISLSASCFVAALDVTIIATALPAISEYFQSQSAYTWVGTAYILANTASTPSWGKVSDIWGRKPIMLMSVGIFLAGSLMCALVNSMPAFIAGRAVQGFGAAGLITLVNITISDLFSMRDRGMYFGLISIVWAFASGVGPVLGGLFTQKLTWRWCFYINVPITIAVFLLLLFTLELETPKIPVWEGLKAVDWSGSALIAGATLMLLLGLNFGGVNYPWDSAMVLCLIVFGAVVGAIFVVNEWKLARYPIIPLYLFRQRYRIASFAVCFCHGFVFMGEAYYIPLYFQAVLGTSPLISGVYLLPFILSLTIMAAFTGFFIQKTGNYIITVYVGLTLLTLGIGLLIDLDVEPNWVKIILFQIVAGMGVGLNFEGPLLSMQATISLEDVATATATFSFVRSISTAISIVIGGVVFQNQMVNEGPQLVAGLGPELASQLGGGNAAANIGIIGTLAPAQQVIVRQAFYNSIRAMWIMYVGVAAVGLFAGAFIGVHTLSKDHRAATIGLPTESKKENRITEGYPLGGYTEYS